MSLQGGQGSLRQERQAAEFSGQMVTSITPGFPDERCFGTEEGKACVLHCEPCQRIKRRLLEVFSIQFFDWQQKSFEGIFGTILLQTSTGPYMLSKRNIDCPDIVDQDGFVKLTGPQRGIEANDYVSIVPFLFHLAFAAFESKAQHDIWRADMEVSENLHDQLMFHRLEIIFGTMEINYAIYKDGAEACLDVTVVDWDGEEVEVYGTVSVRNSKVTDPKARSLLFDSKSEEAISVRPGKVTHLPLLRRVTVLPFGSVLIVDVCLMHRGTIFAQGTMSFIPEVTGDEELILVSHPGKVKVKVTWLKQQVHNEASDN